MSTATYQVPWTTEQVVAELHAAGTSLTSHELADRLAGGDATPPEWWRLAGILERISYHNGATVLRVYAATGWRYVHRDHAPGMAGTEADQPIQSALDLRVEAYGGGGSYHRGRVNPAPHLL